MKETHLLKQRESKVNYTIAYITGKKIHIQQNKCKDLKTLV